MTRDEINRQRFMVSPCGFYSGLFDAAEIADECPDWFDCTKAGMTDTEIGQLMERRMQASSYSQQEAQP